MIATFEQPDFMYSSDENQIGVRREGKKPRLSSGKNLEWPCFPDELLLGLSRKHTCSSKTHRRSSHAQTEKAEPRRNLRVGG